MGSSPTRGSKYLLMKIPYSIITALILVLLSSSCTEDAVRYVTPVAGKTFTADGEYGSAVDYWLLSFNDYGGIDYDGEFIVEAYDYYGEPLPIPPYTGIYYFDYSRDCIEMYFDEFYEGQVWEYNYSYYQDWPTYGSNYDIYVPRSNGIPFGGMTFYAGNIFNAPPSYWD